MKDCFTCLYEPEWHNNVGKCKRFNSLHLSSSDTQWFTKYKDPDEVVCDGVVIKYCICWKPKKGTSKRKKVYTVYTREIYVVPVRVEAYNPDDAIERVQDGDGDQLDDKMEYLETVTSQLWSVKEEEDEVTNNEVITNEDFWDCECEHNYIHHKIQKECKKCGAIRDEQPDSIAEEVEKYYRIK